VLKSLQLWNLLSFGENTEPLELRPLNVLIGPNGSGKSNLIEAIGLAQSTPRDFAGAIRKGGGIRDWLWKGGGSTPVAAIELVLDYPDGPSPLLYRLSFTEVSQRVQISDELLGSQVHLVNPNVVPYFAYHNGHPVVRDEGRPRELRGERLAPDQSILSQLKDPERYPQISYLGDLFRSVRLYRNWTFGQNAPPRQAQRADERIDYLEEDAGNLGVMLNRLWGNAKAKRAFLEHLKTFYEDAAGIHPAIVPGGWVQIQLEERDYFTPANRLSDGTLRWIFLLTILLDPSPPPLVCLEEPELGLHPDIMPTLANLLVEASERMQLIVTTHSDALVDALSRTPESVVVCEKEAGATVLRRLKAEEMAAWLEKYSLGELWRSGEIGGNRW
jgi:predicted ATPase